MKSEIVELTEDISQSELYSEDLAPVPPDERTWNTWSLAAIWVGMAVCIPTYLLSSYMIKSGLGWMEALVIIFVANLIVTVPMILNGHGGVKYGIPFPVLGRASFGIHGVHLPAIVRGLVACGWFGIQTWIGGLAFYAIWCAVTGAEPQSGLSFGKFVGFALFWLLNIFFIWKGTESIKWLESFAAPILLLIGVILIGWGAGNANGFGVVLDQASQLGEAAAHLTADETGSAKLVLNPLQDVEGESKATAFRIQVADGAPGEWQPLTSPRASFDLAALAGPIDATTAKVQVQFQGADGATSSMVTADYRATQAPPAKRWGVYIFWLTAMVGFWATMSISIADITRYVSTQKEQMWGQIIGLPGTMLLYSFVGVFVTCASLILFDDILIGEDAPWDPVSLLAKFKAPGIVIVSQIFMVIATLSTNIAANVIAPANAFANAFPKGISFRSGGVLTGVIGIMICPWLLLDEISSILIFVSGLLGPVLGVLVADYFWVRRKQLVLADLFKPVGAYTYNSGWNMAALVALIAGIVVALIGYWVPALNVLYTSSWFSGFIVTSVVYIVLMKRPDPLPSPGA